MFFNKIINCSIFIVFFSGAGLCQNGDGLAVSWNKNQYIAVSKKKGLADFAQLYLSCLLNGDIDRLQKVSYLEKADSSAEKDKIALSLISNVDFQKVNVTATLHAKPVQVDSRKKKKLNYPADGKFVFELSADKNPPVKWHVYFALIKGEWKAVAHVDDQ